MKKYFVFDDEYISGGTYFVRRLLQAFLCLVLVGFYLIAVTSYKRARSLGNSSEVCILFAIWGGLSIIIAAIPGLNLLNVVLHLYLWFSNGTPEPSQEMIEKDLLIAELEMRIAELEAENKEENKEEIEDLYNTVVRQRLRK